MFTVVSFRLSVYEAGGAIAWRRAQQHIHHPPHRQLHVSVCGVERVGGLDLWVSVALSVQHVWSYLISGSGDRVVPLHGGVRTGARRALPIL